MGLGVVGFLDDYIKISQAAQPRPAQPRQDDRPDGRRASCSASWRSRRCWRTSAADAGVRTTSRSSATTSGSRSLPSLVLLLIWFIVTGTSNAVNLTDGLDGLATGARASWCSRAYTLVNIWQNNQSCALEAGAKCYEVRDPLDLAVVAAALTGACFGFLWWNASPAQIFMGDTGSLSLGGAMAGFAIMTRTELLLLVLGGLFVVITLSVMLQVGLQAQRRAGCSAASSGSRPATGSSGWRRCSTTSSCSAGRR